jgi:hypothetical protein
MRAIPPAARKPRRLMFWDLVDSVVFLDLKGFSSTQRRLSQTSAPRKASWGELDVNLHHQQGSETCWK